MPQYFKLARKIHCGAEWVIAQLGYDMRKFYEIKLFMQWAQVQAPVIGNVYVLNKTVAGLFNKNKIPGCVVSDQLYALAEKYAAGPDKGRSFFNELAAKQLFLLTRRRAQQRAPAAGAGVAFASAVGVNLNLHFIPFDTVLSQARR